MLWFRTPQKVYIKKGCLPVALRELSDVLGKKRVFIVTDKFLFENGYTKAVTDRLDEMGIQHTCFFDVAPTPRWPAPARAPKPWTPSSPTASSPWAAAAPWMPARSCG
jgi:acetaldehyde dehydrogenase/alcohol dehydrogenase